MSSLCMHCPIVVSRSTSGAIARNSNGLAMSRTRMRRESLARWSLSQHHITGEFHVPMVLRQFFVTLEHEAPLRPGPVWLAHGLREGAGLIAVDACEVVW